MTIELRPYQQEDYEFFLKQPKSLILYEPRLGKTVMGLKLAFDGQHKNVLIVCPKNAIAVFEDHIDLMAKDYPNLKVRRYTCYGIADKRKAAYFGPRGDITFYITTYGSLIADVLGSKKIPGWLWEMMAKKQYPFFDCVIADEADRMRNRKSKAFEALDRLGRNLKRWHPMIGTPVSKGPQDIWTMLNICNRSYFSSYWRYVAAFCETMEDRWSEVPKIVGPKNMPAFYNLLHMYARIRTRAECAPWMPKIQRSLKRVQMNKEQHKLYMALEYDKFAFTPGMNMVVAQSTMEQIIRFRQILCCPKMLDPLLGLGAAFEDILDYLEEASTPEEKHIVIFTPYRKCQEHFKLALQDKGYNVFVLNGTVHPDEVRSETKKFRDTKGIMLCTIKFAQAFTLAPAYCCFFIGYDWDPNANRQAEDRLIPQEGVNPISSVYYAYDDSVDYLLAETVNLKHEIIKVTLDLGNRRFATTMAEADQPEYTEDTDTEDLP